MLERSGIEALVIHLDGGGIDPVRRQDLERAIIGRLLDQHSHPGEALGQEDDSLQRPVGDEDARRVDAVPLGDPLPERRVAPDGAV